MTHPHHSLTQEQVVEHLGQLSVVQIIELTKAVRASLGLGLAEGKTLIESVASGPKILKEGLNK